MIDAITLDLSSHRLNKAKELLHQSEILLKNCSYDGSINRSYYAIFNAIRSMLALINLDSPKHSGVISFFDRYFVKTEIIDKFFSQVVHTAFETRQVTDYEDFYMPTLSQAQQQFDNAKNLIDELEKKIDLLIQQKIPIPSINNE